MILSELEELFNGNVFCSPIKREEKLSRHTTINIGGNAEYFFEPENEDSLSHDVKILIEHKIPFFVLGGGSNVVISDDGLGVVISTRRIVSSKKCGIEILPEYKEELKAESESDSTENFIENSSGNSIENYSRKFNSDRFEAVRIYAGQSWGSVIKFSMENNLSGFEPFTLLSGTVGGALFMNASCFSLSADRLLLEIKYFDCKTGEFAVYRKNSSDWGYKTSPFQKNFPFSEKKIIVSAVFALEKKPFNKKLSDDVALSRREKGHFKFASAGSVFKNIPEKNLIAGKIIDECGLKGMTSGGAQIAPFHANFIVNPQKNASFSDVYSLVEFIKKDVQAKKNIELECEIIFVTI